MKREFKIIGLLLLMLTSLFSVGFASWTITYSYSVAEVSGSFEADDVVESKNFIEIEVIDVLKYNSSGFMNPDRTRDSIVVRGTVDLNGCRTSFENSTQIQIELKLKYADNISTTYNLFNKIESTTATQKIPSNKDLSLSTAVDSSYYKAQIVINLHNSEYLSQNEFSFELSFNFFIEDSSYFSDANSPLSKSNTSLFKLTSVVSAM